MPDFVHLHLHSHYSVLDGVCLIDPLVARAKELGMRELALTDHGTMYGVIEFYKKAQNKGLKPILGFEAYVAPGSRHERSTHGIQDAAYHLTLLARDEKGYRNLCALCTAGYLEGFYYRPRVDKELLRAHAEGLIALSGCLGGEVQRNLLAGSESGAEAAAREYREIFGEGNFLLEIMQNGLEEQKRIMPMSRQLSLKTGIPLVATSDVHYLLPEHALVQEVLLCIQTGKRLADEKRMRMETSEYYLKSAEQMRLAFAGYEDACDRTVEVAARCNCNLDGMLQGFQLPRCDPPDGLTPAAWLERLCREGLARRYGDPLPAEVEARCVKELKVIGQMGFPGYFLIVWDLVNFARQNGIAVGPGRGSAAGSIVAYALGITNLDPLKYGLLFERFLNEGRREMPDIDLDFDKERRPELIEYLIGRHGRDQCAQIVTFGCISAKSAIRDVGRVTGMPLHEVDVIAKMIPDGLKPDEKTGKSSIEVALAANPDLAELARGDARVKELLDIAGKLDGVLRQTGIHASGVLVAPRPILEYGPLAKRGDEITTQYEMKVLDRFGLCKIDVLGLETLTLLKKAVAVIRENAGVEIDLDALPLDDAPTYRMLQRGDAKGIFQFESGGFRDLLVKLRPDRFEDLIAAVAMYRPGPLGAGLVDTYIRCKHGQEKASYLHPLIEPILRETHGLILYQEQVQALALQLAKFSLSEGDLMRRAMGKKDPAIMAEYRGRFIEQAADTIGKKVAAEVFDQIEYFAGYGFNKSHSACYGYISYQTAYLKCHWPKEYMAALLTTNRGDIKKVVEYIDDARRMGIEVLPPDLNESDATFTVVGNRIRFGLSAIKGVGDKAVESVVAERKAKGPYRTLFDFCSRIEPELINKGTIEALIAAGAFDSLGGHRAQFVAALETARDAGAAARRDRLSGQLGLFGAAPLAEPALPDVPRWSDPDQLAREKAVLGFYVSSHPLARHAARVAAFATATTAQLSTRENQSAVTVGGLIAQVQPRTDKNNNRMARLVIEDMEGAAGAVVFSRTYEKVKELLKVDDIVFLQAKVDRTRDEPALIVDDVIPLDRVEEILARYALVSLETHRVDETLLGGLEDLLRAHRGETPVYFRVRTAGRRSVLVRAGRGHGVKASAALASDLEKLLGPGHVTLGARAM